MFYFLKIHIRNNISHVDFAFWSFSDDCSDENMKQNSTSNSNDAYFASFSRADSSLLTRSVRRSSAVSAKCFSATNYNMIMVLLRVIIWRKLDHTDTSKAITLVGPRRDGAVVPVFSSYY